MQGVGTEFTRANKPIDKSKGKKKGTHLNVLLQCKNEGQTSKKDKKWKKRKERKNQKNSNRIQSGKEEREEGDTTGKVRGKTEGEIGKVSAEKGDTLVLPHRFTRQWRVIRGTACLLDPAYWLHQIPNTKQYHPGRWSQLIGRCGDLTRGPFSPFCFFFFCYCIGRFVVFYWHCIGTDSSFRYLYIHASTEYGTFWFRQSALHILILQNRPYIVPTTHVRSIQHKDVGGLLEACRSCGEEN